MKLLSLIPKLIKHVIQIRNWRPFWYHLLDKYICSGKTNESTSFAIDNMCYVSSKYKNKRVHLGAVKFKTKDQKFLRTLLIFTLIPLMPKKCGLLINFYEFVQKENERVSNTHIHTISCSYKILYFFLHIID